MSFQIETNSDILEISFSGSLNMDSIAKIWEPCINFVTRKKPETLVLNMQEVAYCDGAGIALIQALQKYQDATNQNFQVKNLDPCFKNLLFKETSQQTQTKTKPPKKMNFLEKLGNFSLKILADFRENIVFLGALAYQIYSVILTPKKFRWFDFWRAIDEIGPKALPIIALVGFLIGLISTFQAAPSFEQFGAQILMVNLVSLGLVREMGPLLTAVLLAGRTASAFAAEIGTMKINQEVNALTTMGLSPIRFLVVPRILAAMFMTPLLEAFLIIFGLLGCFAVMKALGYSLDAFLNQVQQSIKFMDYFGGFIKVFVFGWIIAGVGCLHGLKTSFDAQAVGRSTTLAVVNSLIMLVIADGIFATVYYVLGI